MIIDIIILLILLASAGLAYRKGLAVSVVSTLSWVVCAITGFLFSKKLKLWLVDNTKIDEYINGILFTKSHTNIQNGNLDGGFLGLPDLFNFSDIQANQIYNKIAEFLGDADNLTSGLPDFLKKPVESATESISIAVADKATDLIMGILAFFLIIFGLKLLFGLITLLLSKKYRRGAVGCLDGLGGLTFGLIRGVIIVLLVFVVLVPVVAMVNQDFSQQITDQINTSQIAPYIYNKNIILKIMTM